MNFQTHCDHYLQQINETRSDPNATPELSLHTHMQTFLQTVAAECFDKPDITWTNEPKSIDQIGRPDYIASDGLLPIGYIEAEAYRTDLKNLTGHAKEQNDHFRKLAALGQELIDWHLLKDMQIPHRHRFEGEGDGVIGTPRYEDGSVWINDTQYFTDVTADVWEYEIGAYQVCKKWLKDRRGEVLSHAEVRQYRGILVAVAEKLRVMGEIDEVLEL